MAEENATLVRRCINEMINCNNLALADELFIDDNVNPTPGDPPVPPGPKGMRQTVTDFRSAFPDDIPYAIDDLFGACDSVAVRRTASGTNTGPLMGLPPTGKRVAPSSVYLFPVAGGKPTEAWGDFDTLGMQRQLGLLHVPAAHRSW